MVMPPGPDPGLSGVDGQPVAAATRVDPLRHTGVVSHAARSCEEPTVMIMVVDAGQAETDLAAGTLRCPRCAGGVLRPWAWARTRLVRQRDGSTARVRPRRARCRACRVSQVLLPGWCLPRRADAADVVGAALLAHAGGAGYRAIAAELRRPQATVRRWLRAVGGRHTEWLRIRGVQAAARLDRETLTGLGWQPKPTALAHALNALGAAARAYHRWLYPRAPAWTLVTVITGGWLLAPAPSG